MIGVELVETFLQMLVGSGLELGPADLAVMIRIRGVEVEVMAKTTVVMHFHFVHVHPHHLAAHAPSAVRPVPIALTLAVAPGMARHRMRGAPGVEFRLGDHAVMVGVQVLERRRMHVSVLGAARSHRLTGAIVVRMRLGCRRGR